MRNMYFRKNSFFEAKIKSHNWIFLAPKSPKAPKAPKEIKVIL